MLPSLQLLEKVSKEIMSVPNRKKESKRRVHFCCFLLCHKAGLRISEAVSFDLANKTRQGLYRIERPKGKKERLVYIPKKVIRELRKNNWKPNQTNRFNFYHFLRKIKRELKISESTQLTPHTLRRSFTTYHAEKGMPLPLLQKLLGHSSIRTTALYWQNIYREPDNDIGSILATKNWLEGKERPKPPPITENFPETLEVPKPIFIDQKPLIPNKQPIQQDKSLPVSKTLKKAPRILTNEISPSTPEKFLLNPVSKKSDQLKTSQPLPLTANKDQKPTERELILLQKINQLEEQLNQTITENSNLTAKLAQSEKEKAKLEVIVIQEKQRADNCQQQLKAIVRTLKKWQKINYYKQLEQGKSQVQRAQIIQPPPWKAKS